MITICQLKYISAIVKIPRTKTPAILLKGFQVDQMVKNLQQSEIQHIKNLSKLISDLP